jgi:hypothetical protein
MLIGYNNDVEYRGKQFHIQTEDHGMNLSKIESQVFHQGQILDTEYVDYGDIVEEHDGSDEALNKRLQSLLLRTHKGLYKRLVAGEYDDMVGLEPLDDPEEVDKPAPEEFEPGQDRVPAAAQQIEEEGEEAFEQFHENQAQKHVDLDNLKDHLSGVDEEEEEEVAETAQTDTSSKVDEALADVGESLGEPSEPSITQESEVVATDESDEQGYVESRPGKAVSSMGAEESNTGMESPSTSQPTTALSDSQLPSPEAVEAAGAAAASSNQESSGPKPELDLSAIPDRGTKSWKGCEEPDSMLSLVPLVEGFLSQ